MRLEIDVTPLSNFFSRLEDTSSMDKFVKEATEKLTQTLRLLIRKRTPIGETHQLQVGWDGNNLSVKAKRVTGGFQVSLVNEVEYAAWVNDGHRVRNKADGPYLKVHTRVKVPVAKQWQEDASDWYVFGHFFVEEGIIEIDDKIGEIIYPYFEDWFRWCLSG